MALKIKLTKNELKKQKDALKRFKRYLPTLILKKQQLQMEIRAVEAAKEQKRREQAAVREAVNSWVGVFGEGGVDLPALVALKEVRTGRGNIAGVDIPVFQGISFEAVPYDVFALPLWVDKAVTKLQELVSFDIQVKILDEQAFLLGEELRITTQRVNLFEKIKIPETKQAIRQINIYLGDQQTAAVVRGKIAKSNLLREETA